MKDKSTEKNQSSYQKPIWESFVWVSVTLIIILIGAAPPGSELILDFFPELKPCQKWIKVVFISVFLFILFCAWWWRKHKKTDIGQDSLSFDELSKRDELLKEKKIMRKFHCLTWRQKIFKNWPLNIITFKFIPLLICWIISLFVNKKYKPYGIDSFKFPKDWEDYKEKIKKYYKIIFGIHISNPFRSYEVKFGKDFQHIEIRWTNANERKFNNSKKELYKNIFSVDELKHIKIFTWVTPFGLYWNLKRTSLKIKEKIFRYTT